MQHPWWLLMPVLFVVAACNPVREPPRRTESDDKVIVRNINQPELSGREVSQDVVRSIGGIAPAGYAWDYRVDWDGTVVRKCLRDEQYESRGAEGAVPIGDEVAASVRSVAPPEGYHWVTPSGPQRGAPTNVALEVCLWRIGCPYGKIPQGQQCIPVE